MRTIKYDRILKKRTFNKNLLRSHKVPSTGLRGGHRAIGDQEVLLILQSSGEPDLESEKEISKAQVIEEYLCISGKYPFNGTSLPT